MAVVNPFEIANLGKANIPSPIKYSKNYGDSIVNYVGDDEKILYDIHVSDDKSVKDIEKNGLIEIAGPRENIYYNPQHVHAGIVTCGGLCPGLNDVIRAIVRTLWYGYGIRRISGIPYGFRGFLSEFNFSPMELNPNIVDDIHKMGGTTLGSSRGSGDRVSEIVDSLERMNMNMLFTIGGDGTQRATLDIAEEVIRRGLKISVIGIPKTIDNDLNYTQRTFGFETAVAKAVEAVASAHVEAKSAMDGVGLVKVMGRESGFIATNTALSSNEANFVLIPEVPFEMKGHHGLLHYVDKRLDERHHAVILVAEGAGQDFIEETNKTDASGNKKLADIGVYLRDTLKKHFEDTNRKATIKYIDPSYMIRASVALPSDSLYCARLGANAVHAAMAGKTKMLITLWNDTFVNLPIKLAVADKKFVDPESSLWRDVLETTRQPTKLTAASSSSTTPVKDSK